MSDLDSFLQEIDQIEATIASNPAIVEYDASLPIDQDNLKKGGGAERSDTDTSQPVKDQSSAEQTSEKELSRSPEAPDESPKKEPLSTPPTETSEPTKEDVDGQKQGKGKSSTSSSATIVSSFKPATIRKKPLIAAPPIIKAAAEISSPAVPQYSISKPAAPKSQNHVFGSDILFSAVTAALMGSDSNSPASSTSTPHSAPLLPTPLASNPPAAHSTSHNYHAYAAAGIPVPSPADASASDSAVGYNSSAFTAGVKRSSRTVRRCAGEVWEDKTLADWPENDFRLFVGDLGGDVTDAMLAKAFSHYPSFAKARMIIDKNKTNGKLRGYGFVSFLDPWDCLAALKNEQGKYLGARPMKLRKSNWKNKDIEVSKRMEKEREKRIARGF